MPQELIFFISVLLFVLVASFFYTKFQIQKLKNSLENSIGKLNDEIIRGDHLEKIKVYSEKVHPENTFYVDDITNNDLDLDNFYSLINTTISKIGSEYLYSVLRHLKLKEIDLFQRNKSVNYLENNQDKIVEIYFELSKIRGLPFYLSFYEQILELKNQRKDRSHLIHFMALILSIILSVINPEFGVPLMSIVLMINVGRYFLFESNKSSNLNSFNGLVSASIAYNRLAKKHPDILESDIAKKMSVYKRGSFVSGQSDTNEFQFLLKFLFYVTHLDFVYYYRMLGHLQTHFEDVLALFEAIGELETALVIYNLRQSELMTCSPIFKSNEPLIIDEMIHPLVSHCVPNNVKIDQSLLITGSNASGKSTYIKGIALNIVCAQTLNTCFCARYEGPFYKVLSSMALKDSIETEESYFMVEIRSLNRIVNEPQEDVRVIGFIDEILRGTNTIERIAASSAVLNQFIKNDKRFVAATHDIELTRLLQDRVKNQHFSETLKDDDISFDYLVKSGPSQSRNAIKLLEVSGYSKELIEEANSLVLKFEKEGQWV